jgi:hypothetical protein
MKTLLRNIMILLLAGFTGCAGLTHHRNEEALKSVKKVAVIGFSLVEPTSAKLGIDLGSGKTGAVAGGSMITKKSPEVEEMYLALVKSYAKNMGWQVVPPGVMKQNSGYQAAYDRTMKGFQNKYPVGQGQQQFLVDGIMDRDSARILGNEGRTKLIQALGVDAIISADVHVVLNGTSVMGFGSRKPQANLSFQLFRPNTDSADWFEGQIKGDEATKSVGATAFIDESLLHRLSVESARTAFAKIGSKK